MAEIEVDRDRTERWFVRQGLPHLIDSYSVREDVLTRMFPFLSLVVFLELFLGEEHSCGLKIDGLIACWGNGRQGQLDWPLPTEL